MTDNRAGFTLVEALAAVTILAAGLVLIQQIYATTARAEFSARQLNTALWVAEEQMARAWAGPLKAEELSGMTRSGVAWRRSIAPLFDQAQTTTPGLWLIEVFVQAGGTGRQVRLETLRYGATQ